MPIEIIIKGNHATDVFAEIRNLADALSPKPAENTASVPAPKAKEAPKKDEPVVEDDDFEFGEEKKAAPKTKAKYSAKDQKEIADNMIAEGEIDDEVFADLNKTQQDRIKKALAAPKKTEEKKDEKKAAPKDEELDFDSDEEEEKEELDFDSEDEDDAEEVVNLDTLRDLVEKKSRDKDGKVIPTIYAEIRDEMKKIIPTGQAVKFGSIPQKKVASFYAFVKKLGNK